MVKADCHPAQGRLRAPLLLKLLTVKKTLSFALLSIITLVLEVRLFTAANSLLNGLALLGLLLAIGSSTKKSVQQCRNATRSRVRWEGFIAIPVEVPQKLVLENAGCLSAIVLCNLQQHRDLLRIESNDRYFHVDYAVNVAESATAEVMNCDR
jgi:hypothetical protein